MRRLVVLIIILIIILGLASAAQKYFPALQQFAPATTFPQGTEKIKVVTEESVTIDIVKKSGPSVVTVSGQSTAPQSNSVSPFDLGPFGGFFGFGPQTPGGPSQPDQSQLNQPESIGSGFIITQDGL